MSISFYYEYGRKKEIGTGHKFRSRLLGDILKKRGYRVDYTEEEVITSDTDVLVVDHIASKSGLINTAKTNHLPVVLIDGAAEDIDLVDASISAFVNKNAKYTGSKYVVIPKCTWSRHNIYVGNKKKCVFVGIGGYDYSKTIPQILKVLKELGLSAIIAPNINQVNYRDIMSSVEIMSSDDDYYDAMHECMMAITSGGLTFFQAIHYGIPTIAMPQYEHQHINIDACMHCSIKARDINEIKNNISVLQNSEYYRLSLSTLSRHYIDGLGAERVADIIESFV